MKYYSTQRPVGPGTFPMPVGNQIREIVNYDCRTFIEEIGREAWGHIEYAEALPEQTASAWELTPAPAFMLKADFREIEQHLSYFDTYRFEDGRELFTVQEDGADRFVLIDRDGNVIFSCWNLYELEWHLTGSTA